MPNTTLISQAGYYGKIPSLGDFIRHNLPREFIDPWDDWLQSAIHNSKKQLADNWLDSYLTCPIYRFMLTPGLCGETGWLGILMPSVDRVGRYFPMTFCIPISAPVNPFMVLPRFEPWLISVETIALSCLEDCFDHSLLVSKLNEQNTLLPDLGTLSFTNDSCAGDFSSDTLAIRHVLDKSAPLSNCFSGLLNSVLLETGFAFSLWWTEGSETVDPSILVSQGLPPIDSISALFDGQWHRWGWLDLPPTGGD